MNPLTNMVDAVGTTVYSYDSVGQLLSEGGLWPNDTVSYTYANRLRTGLSLQTPNASAWNQTYGYDVTRRLTNTVSPAGTFGYIYGAPSTASALVDAIFLPNGASITNTYDSVARLLSTALKNSGNTNLDSYAYLYNPAGQRTNVVRTAGDYVNYTYDNEGELKTAIGKESGGTTNRLQEQFGYAYDAAGNLNYRTNNTLLQAFNVNNLNELTSVTNGGQLTVAGTTTVPATNVTVNTSNAFLYADATFASTNQPWVNGNNTYTAIGWDSVGNSSTNSVSVNLSATNLFAYDLNGNMVTNGSMVLDYDDENELIRITVTNAWKTEFTYDGKLRRRIRKDFTWSGGWVQTKEVRYIWDGDVVIQERDFNNVPFVTYTRGNDSSGTLQRAGGIGGLLARTDNGLVNAASMFAQAYYHADGNGNITALIYTNQLFAAKYLYGPFGEILSMSGPIAPANTYRFSSMEYYEKADVLLYHYRPYFVSLQRWPNQDPTGEEGGENLYKFTHNNSINDVDPFGLKSWLDVINALKQRAAATDAANVMCRCDCEDGTYNYDISGGVFLRDTVYAHAIFPDVTTCGPFNTTYYWWDCYSGTEEGDKDNKGWSVGFSYYFKTATPSLFMAIVGMTGRLGDPDKLDVSSVVIYERCVHGKLKTKIESSSHRLEFSLSIIHNTWTGPTSTSNP